MIRVKIAGTGSYLPERVVTNDELAERLPKTSDEWIFSHTGIRSRHIAAADESASSMGLMFVLLSVILRSPSLSGVAGSP